MDKVVMSDPPISSMLEITTTRIPPSSSSQVRSGVWEVGFIWYPCVANSRLQLRD